MKRFFVLATVFVATAASAEPYVGDPTGGVVLPVTPLAGDADATAVVANPAGLGELRSWHFEAAFTGLDGDNPEAEGGGFGFYAATPLVVPLLTFLPRMGFGVGFEKLAPPRVSEAPDAGTPFRFTLGYALMPSRELSLGASWHHFGDDASGVVDGLDTFDAGLTLRLGGCLAVGLVVRDLLAPVVASIPLERVYDGELVVRPFGDDRLELAPGVAIGERRGGVDPRLRFSLRLARGAWIRGLVEARTLWLLDDPSMPAGFATRKWDGRGTIGLEVSFGDVGVGAYATGAIVPGGKAHGAGMTGVARWSGEHLPPLVAHADHVVRLKLNGSPTERQLVAILSELRHLERDDSVRGVVLKLDGMTAGWASLQELRDGIARLRAHKKPVFAYITAGSTRDYYLAAAATKIYLDAGGGLRLIGLASSAMYLKDLFDKVGVVAQFEKIEEFKSAPEQFTQDGPSAPARAMRESILDDVYAKVVADLAHDRGRPDADVRRVLDNGPYTAGEAGQEHIVDALVEPRDLERLIAVELGDFYPIVDATAEIAERDGSWARPQVAVILVEGDIVDGKSVDVPLLGQHVAGGETIAQSIIWARENARVEAIVLRVNSPGGSALASEVIAREVQATRGVKPIIVSMGDVAASGGYFAAAPGDVILADPSTVTGSIGIFTGKFDMSALFARLGVTWDTLRRGPHADMESFLRPYTDDERKQIKAKLRFYYLRFVDTVARGRNLTEAQVDEIGRGHVWTGAQAKERHLIDRFGGLADALALAKQRAGLDEDDVAELVVLPAAPNAIHELLSLVGGTSVGLETAIPAPLRALWSALPASLVVEPDAPQARLPFNFVDQ